MSISVRNGIAWGDGPSEEPTDTLVLTGKRYFVDCRVWKNSLITGNTLDWAFAGTKSSTDTLGQTHSTWHHTVDSRTFEPTTDEGILWPDPNDPLKTIERGSMCNPATGLIEDYEEIWLDEDPPAGTLVAFLEKGDGLAIVGVIGNRHIGVGRDFAWRKEEGYMLYAIGNVDGSDIALPEEASIGDEIGPWIVREFWRT
ncbi:hypothetical protein OF83DRAFT_1051098 [Amylostereum chailletii]|nr:hypothetical protein OF83DRAFT_1051098 [Amylostereum chailletii]